MPKLPTKTTLPKAPIKELRFELSGNMNRYVWSLDNKVVSEADRILIKKGENVRIILYNGSMMRPPHAPTRTRFQTTQRTRGKDSFEKCCGYYADGNRYLRICRN